MTAAEQASLEALRTTVESGFAEIRALMESRRLEEAKHQAQIEQRLAAVEATASTNRVIIRLGGWLVGTSMAVIATIITVLHR